MWSEIDVGGKRVDVFEPSATVLEDAAVLYLHGHSCERLPQVDGISSLLQQHRLRVVAPQGGPCWWLDRICKQFDPHATPQQFLLHQLLPWCQERWQVSPPNIGLLGVSMGGQGALNLAYRQARRFPCVAAISPTIDFHKVYGRGWPLDELFDSSEAARQQTATLHLHPLNWPKYQFLCCDPLDRIWFESCERLISKLASMGIPYECDLATSAGGHGWEYFSLMMDRALGFLRQSLSALTM